MLAPAGAPHQDVGRSDVVQQQAAVAGVGGRHGDVQYASAGVERFQESDVTKLHAKYSAELTNIKESPSG